jgi:sugar phosphate permease
VSLSKLLHALEKEMAASGSDRVETMMTRREWAVVLLLVISAVINYVDRSNLSIAAPLIQRQFNLSPMRIGSLLSAFFWTYALMQISGIAGWFSDRFPVGWVMFGGYVLWSGATVITGLTSSYAGLFATRESLRSFLSSSADEPTRSSTPAQSLDRRWARSWAACCLCTLAGGCSSLFSELADFCGFCRGSASCHTTGAE